jgi:hypothetical protein
MTAPAAPSKKKLSLDALSPELREIVKSRGITGTYNLKPLLHLLGELGHFDEAVEAASKSALNRTILFFVLTFLGLFGGILLASFSPLFLLIPAGMLVLAIRYLLKRRALQKLDMINDFRICLRPALRQLADDLAPGEKIRVRMDLSGPTPPKQTTKMELPPGRYQKLTETVFEDPWCEVRLAFLDGSSSIVEFHNRYRKLDRRYRSSRGKIKWKTKWRKECMATVTLMPSGGASWDKGKIQERMNPEWEKLKYVDKEGVTGARLVRYWVFKGASDPPGTAPPSREIVGMLLRLHSALNARGEVAR